MTDKKLLSIVGRSIRAYRKQKGLTLEKLADLAGIDWGFLSRIETNSRAPSLPMLARISDALGVDPSDLLVDPTGTSKADLDRRLRALWTRLGRQQRDDLLAILAKSSQARELRALRIVVGG